MLYPETLQRGDWVAVVGLVDQAKWTDEDERCAASFNGRPVKVILYEEPFLVVENRHGGRGALDLREVVVKRFSRKYANAMLGNRRRDMKASKQAPATAPSADPKTCPRCGGRLVQILVIGQGWPTVCQQCGLVGKPG